MHLLRVFAAMVLLAAGGSAHALSLTVSPADLRLAGPSGSTISDSLVVTNNTAGPVTMTAYAWDWWYGDEGGHYFGPPGSVERTAALWVTLTPEEMTLEPGQSGHVEVHVSLPGGLSGGYYAIAFVEARAGRPSDDGFSMRPAGRVGVPVMIAVDGTGTVALDVLGTAVEPPTSTAPLTVSLDARNAGDLHVFAEFMGVVRAEHSGQVHGQFRGKPLRLLPGQARTMDVSWSGELPSGDYEVMGSVVYGDGRSEVVRQRFSVDLEPDWAP